jgi:uncharacterized membrane protein YjjP (DUF1212 family)
MSHADAMKSPSWAWIVAPSILWPFTHSVVFISRFGEMPATDAFGDLLLFFPTGLVGGLVLRELLKRSHSRSQARVVLFFTSLSVPLAFVGNLGGGLLGPAWVTVGGVLPLVAGSGLGWFVGRGFSDRSETEAP